MSDKWSLLFTLSVFRISSRAQAEAKTYGRVDTKYNKEKRTLESYYYFVKELELMEFNY